jgi:hypothetical protein
MKSIKKHTNHLHNTKKPKPPLKSDAQRSKEYRQRMVKNVIVLSSIPSKSTVLPIQSQNNFSGMIKLS